MTTFRVALVGPEFEENLGLRYLQAALEKAGYEARIFDFRDRDQIEPVTQAVLRWAPIAVGLSMMFTRRSHEFADLATSLRNSGFDGHLTAGGHFASLNAEALLRDVPALNSVVVGEGEETLIQLLNSLGNPAPISGVVRRLSDGGIQRGPASPAPDELDTRAWPKRNDALDCILGLPLADVLSGRGCWANCRFCSIEAWHRTIGGKRFRQRSVENIADEMAWLYKERGARIFNFTDDNFFLPDRRQNLKRFVALRRCLDERGVGRVALQIKARPDCIDPEILTALAKLGVFRIFLGIESASSRALQALGRGTTVEQNKRALDLIVEAGFHVSYNLLMFEPETTVEDVRENIAFIRARPEVPIGFCRTEVYGGTALEAKLREQNRLVGDYFGYDYRIADPTAEMIFRWQHEVFETRAFDLADGMGPRSMALDHQLHLLEHFWPQRVRKALKARVHDFTRELNEHTASVLSEMCDFALTAPSPAQAEERLEKWKAECAEFERGMDRRSKRLLVEMLGLAKVADVIEKAPFPWATTSLFCVAIFVAAIAIVTIFGQHLRGLFAASTELAGNVSQLTEDQPGYQPPPREQGKERKRGLDKFNDPNGWGN